jgi:fluoroquinolone resistance protein
MNRVFIEDNKYENQRFPDSSLKIGEYESCTFKNCDFSNSNLSEINFINCRFHDCNFSLTNVTNSSFREVLFEKCKLLGLHFDECNGLLISMGFSDCYIELCSFTKLNLKSTLLTDSKVYECDFTNTNLKSTSFQNCDLLRTIFDNTNLELADFRTAFNYSIDPDSNRIKRAHFSINGIAGLLDKYDIDIEK